MGSKTGISWTDSTWNPWIGCHKVSEGCKNCYMFREQIRYGNDPDIVRRSKTTFLSPLYWQEPRKIFTCSWSDFFIEEADKWRDDAWDVIRRTPQHTYQILTKRINNVISRLPDDWGDGYPNVWLGVTVENYKTTDRAEALCKIPASLRFISYEPALTYVNFTPYMPRIQWIIAGCESGENARETNLEWIRLVRNDCVHMGVAFFLKQIKVVNEELVKEPFIDGRQWLEIP